MKARVLSLQVLIFLAAELTHAGAAPIVPHPANVNVQVRFGNLPGGEVSTVLKSASRAVFSGSTASVSPPLSFDVSRVLLPNRPGSPNLDDVLIVEAAPLLTDPGYIYSVGLSLVLPDSYNPARQSTRPLHAGETDSVSFEDCPAMLDIRFVNHPGGPPVRVERAQFECFEAGIAGSRHALAFIGSETRHKLVVHSGVSLHLVAVSRVATGTPGEWIDLLAEVYPSTPLACDEVRVTEVLVPPLEALGRITGFVEMAGERANLHALGDPTPIYSISTVMAAAGFGGDQFWDSGRYTLLPLWPDLPPLPSGSSGSVGDFELRNLLASEDFGPSFGTLPYTVHGQMQFGTGRAANFFRTPWLFGSSRVLVPRGGAVNVGDMFRMKPSYVRGQVVLEGPPEAGGFRSPLRYLRTASDMGAPAESIKLYSSVESFGLNEVAPGATEPAYEGIGATEFDGVFSGSQCAGPYSLILAGLRGQPSVWDSPRLHLYFNSAGSGAPFIQGKLLITNRPPRKMTVTPFGVAIRDQRYCFGYLELVVQAPAGTTFASFQPGIAVDGEGADYHVQTGGGEDYVGDDRHNLPFLGETTTGRETIVRLMLPAGSYTLTPSAKLVAMDGTVTHLTMLSVTSTVPCRGISKALTCLSVNLSLPPACAGVGTNRITGSVNSCTNNVTRLVWDRGDNIEHVICTNCGANPTFAFDLPGAGPCQDHPFTVTAYDAEGRRASTQAIIPADRTPPVISCPTNLVVPCQSTNGAVVTSSFAATNHCSPTNLLTWCDPPSGSLLPIGTHTVTCWAMGSGQTNQCSFTVTVLGNCQQPRPLRISSVGYDSGGRVQVNYTGETNLYYVLYRGPDVHNINQPVRMALGQAGLLWLVDPEGTDNRAAAFYRLRQVPLETPLDSDHDGMDDVFELRSNVFDPLNPGDGLLDFDVDGQSNAGEYRLHTDPLTADKLIQQVHLTKTNFCVGEEVEVTVGARHPVHSNAPVLIAVNGYAADHRFLHFTGPAGPRIIHVAAATEDGYLESQLITINVQTNCQPPTYHQITTRFNPYRRYTADFMVRNHAALGVQGASYTWDFGDGRSQTTTVPFVSHFYGDSMDGSKPGDSFLVTVKNGNDTLRTRHVVTLQDNYYHDRRKGLVQPRVMTSGRLEGFGANWIGRYSIRNLEPTPLIFTEAMIEYQYGAPNQPSAFVPIAPGDLLFPGGFDNKAQQNPNKTNAFTRYVQMAAAAQLPQFPSVAVMPATSTHPALWILKTTDLPPDVSGIACHLKGHTGVGGELTVHASLYFEVKTNPALRESLNHVLLKQFLEELIRRGWVSNPNEITLEDLDRLEAEGRITRTQEGWEIR